MLELFQTVIRQWQIMCKEDVIIELVILHDGAWGLNSARRLTHSEEDLSLTEFLRKEDAHDVAANKNYFG